MQILYRKRFLKNFESLDVKIQIKARQSISMLQKNPFDDLLNNHKLTWKYKWFASINVTWDYRIIFCELSDNRYEIVEISDIGSHSQLYK